MLIKTIVFEMLIAIHVILILQSRWGKAKS